uniref:UDP-N-acetylglucosamine diphosphorylase n=1 Tax=Syphacia muris TaxID=451379 RepID=A0A0N5AWU2_9BILA
MIDLGFESCNSLFSLQAARIARLQNLAKKAFPQCACKIQWIVMTSKATESETLRHIKGIVGNFGLTMDQVFIFNQGEMPCFDLNGNFILSGKGEIAVAPNGNGGLYTAIKPYLNKFLSMGLQYFHVYCVDNILCRVADPHFIGFCIAKNADCAAKAVEKTDPSEPVGVICRVNGHVKVVEYSELDPDLAKMKISDGRLMFRAGNIANHFFTIEFLQRVCSEGCKLQFHRALKKIPYVNDGGVVINPSKPNGIKLERFVFDVFQYSKNFYVWNVSRESEFSPLKNADTAEKDCLRTCRRDLNAEHHRWLQDAGAVIGDGGTVFIHPLISYAGEVFILLKLILLYISFDLAAVK